MTVTARERTSLRIASNGTDRLDVFEISPDGRMLAWSGTEDTAIWLLDAATGATLRVMDDEM